MASLTRPVRIDAASLRQLAYSEPQAFPVLLDSAAAGPLGRYSILAAYPQASLCLLPDGRLLATGAAAGRISNATRQPGFLDALQAAWGSEAAILHHGGAVQPSGTHRTYRGPFHGGWMVFLGYELAAEVEPQLRLPVSPADAAVPVALALRVPAALVVELQSGDAWALAEPDRPELLEALCEASASCPPGAPAAARAAGMSLPAARLEEEAPELYLRRVRRALDYIVAGDIYQANLSRRWRVGFEPQVLPLGMLTAALYERLRGTNPAPFAALLQQQDWGLLSSSPERLVRVQSGRVETRPIAGTRPRSRRAGEDPREIAALIAHPKERAEHVMLVDLERNDLGRICEPGSVHADPMLFIESYAHVHHIVSSVGGRLRPALTPLDVLRAVFPGGTITGCPKFRCMQIIAELEAAPRGAYTGALGYINHDGSMDVNILIRTLTVQAGWLELHAGAGIVADSDPERELEETRAKARGLLAALQDAG